VEVDAPVAARRSVFALRMSEAVLPAPTDANTQKKMIILWRLSRLPSLSFEVLSVSKDLLQSPALEGMFVTKENSRVTVFKHRLPELYW